LLPSAKRQAAGAGVLRFGKFLQTHRFRATKTWHLALAMNARSSVNVSHQLQLAFDDRQACSGPTTNLGRGVNGLRGPNTIQPDCAQSALFKGA